MRIIGNDPSTPRQAQIVASGTLPSGVPVVVNADGTVSVVEGSAEVLGSPGLYRSSSLSNSGNAAVYDDNAQKVVIVFTDNSSQNLKAVVGTVSGTSISFGSEVVVVAQGYVVKLAYDANAQKIVAVFDNQAIVGTVSGTSISFGSSTTYTSGGGSASDYDVTYDANAQKVVIGYRDVSFYGVAVVGTVSGTSISFGTPVVHLYNQATNNALVYDANAQKVVIFYTDQGNTTYGVAVVGTVSGTSISFGSPVVFESAQSDSICACYDANAQKTVTAFRRSNNDGKAVVGTVSGTSISFGTSVVYASNAFASSSVYDPTAKKVIIGYQDTSDSYAGDLIVGTVSGTSISFDSPIAFESGRADRQSATYDANAQKVVIAYKDTSNSGYGTYVVFAPASTTLTSENYIGMSGGVVDNVPQVIGSNTVFEAANSSSISSTYDANASKVVVAYKDSGNSDYGTAIVGTVSGNSISFGSAVVFESANSDYNSVSFDSSNNKVVIAYRDRGNSNYGTAIVGTVSGTSISFGTPVVFESADSIYISSVFDSNSNKVVIAYTDDGNLGQGTAVVGTVSGTSISFGSATVFNGGSSGTAFNASSFDTSNNKVVIAYSDNNNSQHGYAIVGTVSGTSISFGSEVVFESAVTQHIGSTFDSSNNKVVIVYSDEGNSSYGTAVVGTVSGTSISFGTAVVYETGTATNNSATFDTSSNKVAIAYADDSNSGSGTFITGTVSGTSITFDTSAVFETGGVQSTTSVFDSAENKIVIAYRDNGNSSYGTSVVIQVGSTTRGSVADGDAATVDIVGAVSSNQVSLTAGQSYYVQTDGTLGTTPADPSVFAGTAVAATKLIVKG